MPSLTDPDSSKPEVRRPRLVPEDLAATLRSDGFVLGDWLVEPRRNRIVHAEDGEQRLDPRLIDVLVALAARAGQVVTKDELLAEVWRGTYVSDNSLTQAISRLRRALGDDRQNPSYIETIAKSGYRLKAAVEWNGVSGRPTEVAALPATEQGMPSVPARTGRSWTLGVTLGIALAAVVAGVAWWLQSDSAPTVGSASYSIAPEVALVGKTFGPRLSPDGGYVVFAWQGPEQAGQFDLWIQPLGGDAPSRLTDDTGNERLPAWSPDGREIAFVRLDRGADHCELYRMAALGGPAEHLTSCSAAIRSLDWSPDGTQLVYDGVEAAGMSALFALDLTTGTAGRLTTPEEGSVGDTAARFSPDGSQLAFVRKHGAYRHDVMVMPARGGIPTPLTRHRWGQIRGVDWSADGESLLFASNRAGRYALWSVPATGGEPVRLAVNDTWVVEPDTASEQDTVIYRSFRDSVDLWELPVDGRERTPVQRASSSRSERQPAWSPDGERLAFVSDRSGVSELWSGSVDGTELFRHTDFTGPAPASPAWSPDGRSIVFDVALEGQADLWIVEHDRRQPRRLTDHPAEDRNASFSRDGQTLYFASNRSGSWQIWRMPAVGGTAEIVTGDGGFAAVESLDGSELIFSRAEEPGLWRMPVGGGPARIVVAGLDAADWGSWTVAEDGVYHVGRNPTRILHAGFDGASSSVVHVPARQMPHLGRALSWSAPRGSLLFSMIDHSDDEVMVARANAE